ncbi:hypothetical protein EVAR_65083_1 [Eumeta japonica]|uniref:Uncharacterized protein n=1 Tax=Eumeta variegata TaxID=151549 RepID=A0A4C1YZZ8_EUMVA|nr:hypothetical protein EVAR_65083_1 [Eumeta japonica]
MESKTGARSGSRLVTSSIDMTDEIIRCMSIRAGLQVNHVYFEWNRNLDHDQNRIKGITKTKNERRNDYGIMLDRANGRQERPFMSTKNSRPQHKKNKERRIPYQHDRSKRHIFTSALTYRKEQSIVCEPDNVTLYICCQIHRRLTICAVSAYVRYDI